MNAVISRLVIATFSLGLLGLGSGCIVTTRGRAHGHVQVRDHGNQRHCHNKGGKHRKQVCHTHRPNAGHH